MLSTWHNLRQQNEKPPGNPTQCLAEFVEPKDSGVADYVGAFAVTAGLGIDAKLCQVADTLRQKLGSRGAKIPAKELPDFVVKLGAPGRHMSMTR